MVLAKSWQQANGWCAVFLELLWFPFRFGGMHGVATNSHLMWNVVLVLRLVVMLILTRLLILMLILMLDLSDSTWKSEH